MSEFNSVSHLRRLKMLEGLKILKAGSPVAYILESRIKKAAEEAYREEKAFHARFADSLKRDNLPLLSVIGRLQKKEDWQLKVLSEVLEERGIHDCIVTLFTMKRSERKQYESRENDPWDE